MEKKNWFIITTCHERYSLETALRYIPNETLDEVVDSLFIDCGNIETREENHFYVIDQSCRNPMTMEKYSYSYPLIKDIADRMTALFPKLTVKVYEIKNDFYGHSVTVAGLITGGDLINQLKDKELHGLLLIPEVMLKDGDCLFLDDLTVEEVEKALNVNIDTVSADGADLVNKIIG